jgi:hypothetical protein
MEGRGFRSGSGAAGALTAEVSKRACIAPRVYAAGETTSCDTAHWRFRVAFEFNIIDW